jgi:transcriptional regulator with AAA-type ATPase domain
VNHGDVVRLGKQLAIFVERELNVYGQPLATSGGLTHGAKSRRDWIDPVLELAKSGQCVCIEGGPGSGKATLAKLAAAVRESAGEIVYVDARGDARPQVPAGVRPMTWVVYHVDKLPRPQQLEIAHSVGRTQGVTIIATTSQPLDRAAGDGLVAPWFASLFSGKRVQIPALEHRREDLLGIIRTIADRQKVTLDRFASEYLEALLRAGWPGGVPQLERAITESSTSTPKGAFAVSSIAAPLSRPRDSKPSLPPSADPSLARARLEDALARANGSVASAARSLGMSRQAIYREADRLGLDIARRKLR